jgi:hypothetical protein
MISIVAVSYIFGRVLYNLGNFIYYKVLQFKTIGFSFNTNFLAFDPFFFNIQSFFLLVIVTYVLIIFSMVFGRRLAEGRWAFSPQMLYFFPVFSLIAPFWLMNAIYNTIMKRRPAWR